MGAARRTARKVRLGDVCSIESELVDPRDKQHRECLHIGGANIVAGTGELIDLRSAAEEGLVSGKFTFTRADVLYSKIRPYLRKAALPAFEGLCSADIYPLRPDGAVLERDYLFYLLLSEDFTAYANRVSNRAGMPKVNREQLFAFEFVLPVPQEQRRVVVRVQQLMQRIDEIRTLRGDSRRAAEAIAHGARFEAFQSNAPRVAVGDIVKDGPTNGLYKPASSYGAGTPILRINNFNSGDRFDGVATLKRLRISKVELQRYLLRVGDFVVNRVNGSLDVIGKACTIESLCEPCVFESNMMRFSIDEDKVNRSYVLHFLASPQCRDQIKSKAKVIQQASINQTDVQGLLLPLPPMMVQVRIAEHLDEVAERAKVLRSALADDAASIEALAPSILRRAFAGQL